jgi:hypothetical protein
LFQPHLKYTLKFFEDLTSRSRSFVGIGWMNLYYNTSSLKCIVSIQVLIPDLIFPVYKVDREQSWKNVSKEHLKMPNRYSEAVVFENCLKDYIFFYDKALKVYFTVHQLS